ncbi:MAG: ABC transporter permease [Candidatus Brocadiia bacterium]
MKTHLVNYAIAFAIILCLNFALPRLMPGDPLTAIYGEEAMLQMDPEMEEQLADQYGLNDPPWNQFTTYLNRLVHGDLGYSFYFKAPVTSVILSFLPWTILLVGVAFLISWGIGIVAGIESGWRHGSNLDRGLLVSIMSLSGFPSFFVAVILLLVFGALLQILPLQGAHTPYAGLSGLNLLWDVLKHLILPLTSLILVYVPGMFLLTRNSLISTIGEPFVLTARAKGLADRRVRYHHAARNALLPVITASGIMIATRLITGALFIEIVFSYPGMGNLIRQSLVNRDYPVLQGAVLMTAVLVLGINLLVDLLYSKLDPRVSRAH